MGWDNPPVPWRELQQRLTWGTAPPPQPPGPRRLGPQRLGPQRDGPQPLESPWTELQWTELQWAELHCHSSFSFLDGASSPAELVAEAARRGLAALAITDHDGMYGVPQFAQAAAKLEQLAGATVGTIVGAELSVGPGGRPRGPPGRLKPRPAPSGPVRLILRASTCWSWPATRRATAACAG